MHILTLRGIYMSRSKKDGVYLNIKFERDIYNRLIQVSEKADQTKHL